MMDYRIKSEYSYYTKLVLSKLIDKNLSKKKLSRSQLKYNPSYSIKKSQSCSVKTQRRQRKQLCLRVQ